MTPRRAGGRQGGVTTFGRIGDVQVFPQKDSKKKEKKKKKKKTRKK
jgi:hypothetical protein